MSHWCLYPVGTKCVSVRSLWLPPWSSSHQAHVSIWSSDILCQPFPAGRAFHLQSSEVLLFLVLIALRDRRQFEPKAVNCGCAHLGVCMGMRFLHSHCRWEASKVGGSLVNMAVLCPLRCLRSSPGPQLSLQKGHVSYVSPIWTLWTPQGVQNGTRYPSLDASVLSGEEFSWAAHRCLLWDEGHCSPPSIVWVSTDENGNLGTQLWCQDLPSETLTWTWIPAVHPKFPCSCVRAQR